MPELLSLARRQAQSLLDRGLGHLLGTHGHASVHTLQSTELRVSRGWSLEVRLRFSWTDRPHGVQQAGTQAGNRYQAGGKGLELQQPRCQVGWVWGG